MKLLNKRAQVGNLAGFFMGIGVAAIVLTVVMIIVTELSNTAGENGCAQLWNTTSQKCVYSNLNGTELSGQAAAYNASSAILTKLATAPTWIGLIILAGLAFIVLSFFMGNRGY
jgi:hypothetical protein